ncbi:MAG: AAA family ATPase [Desulfobacterales bacterium]|nr:AAA family ATPase [Desulfobacterales bacterium]
MYIKKVVIENYRGFRHFEASLSKLTVLVGENETGKSNFIEAIALPLSSSGLDYNQKRLNVSDINTDCIKDFYKAILEEASPQEQLKKIPRVSVTVQFVDPQGFYEIEILSKWIISEDNKDVYQIRYDFKPKNNQDFLSYVKDLLEGYKEVSETRWFTLPVEQYEYQIVSTNNERTIGYNELKHVVVNIIGAERDDFSDSKSFRSNNMLTKLLIDAVGDTEKKEINYAYTEFFSEIKKTDIFKKVLSVGTDFENIKNFVDDIECIPNLPNLKNILSNITLGYGNEFLYQKGLGERNLVYMFLLFTYYKTATRSFNLCCIEEPEAHLCVNNLRLAIDYINKSMEKSNSMLQSVLSTHNPSVINKLKINNVVVFTGDNAISLSTAGQELQDYLRKRPNFDILKLLFAERVVLVEGPSDEMLINAFLSKKNNSLNNIEVISIGQKGYRTFLDIWLQLNKGNASKKIGVVRDFDNQPQAQMDHDKYDQENDNITVRTTKQYTLEDDFVRAGDNCKKLSVLFDVADSFEAVSEHMKNEKTDEMLNVCDAILREKNPVDLVIPKHIAEVLEALS